jgi:hypothetical protein
MIGSRELPRELGEPRVIVYHACAAAATGSVLGPHDALAYWWAGADGVRLVPAEPIDTAGRAVLVQAVMAAIDRVANGSAAARAQDDRAEAPDL